MGKCRVPLSEFSLMQTPWALSLSWPRGLCLPVLPTQKWLWRVLKSFEAEAEQIHVLSHLSSSHFSNSQAQTPLTPASSLVAALGITMVTMEEEGKSEHAFFGLMSVMVMTGAGPFQRAIDGEKHKNKKICRKQPLTKTCFSSHTLSSLILVKEPCGEIGDDFPYLPFCYLFFFYISVPRPHLHTVHVYHRIMYTYKNTKKQQSLYEAMREQIQGYLRASKSSVVAKWKFPSSAHVVPKLPILLPTLVPVRLL